MHAVMEGLAHIRREGCASGIESRMQTRDQLYDLLDYSPTSPSGWKMPQPGLQPGRITLQRQQRRAYSTTPHRRAYSSTSLLRQGRAFSSTPPKVNDDSTTPHRRQQRGAFSSTPPPPKVNDATAVLLPRTTNQALAIGQFATDWCAGAFAGTGGPDGEVKRRTVDFFVDSVMVS